ncbi:MAG: porphobilinogen synthase [Fusobacterium sp.]|uniref:porphobilinogen synthase n=1 Tax=Fusobacterium sp. TaxID=68766 RepID=UPI0026DD9801|nr:porphobilinogen synthase [Fusobacterium sp.]MDO4689705.1 porphobilinogen synthase [Fusobacterium sp.]
MFTRTRRLRKNFLLREMVKNVNLDISSFIYPIFVTDGQNIKSEIPSMPEQFRYSLDRLNEELDELLKLGIKSILLFGIPEHKDEIGSQAYSKDGIVQRAIRQIKKNYGDKFLIITDVCMCEYTSHGHCGVLHNYDVDNDKTLEYLAKIALSHAEAGTDIIAPSDMMDGRILKIRSELDKNNFKDISIMAYSVKYSSAYYGPFREAADSCPSFGDRKSYQMDFRNNKNFYREVEADTEEGADFIMVKPAMAYLDVIKKVSEVTDLPVVAYNVSGEYSMVKAAAQNGWIDEEKIVIENMFALKRAGAEIIISYHAKDIAKWLKK